MLEKRGTRQVVEYRAHLRRRPLLFARLEVLSLPSHYVYFAHCDIHGIKIKILGNSNIIIKIFKGYNNYCASSKKYIFLLSFIIYCLVIGCKKKTVFKKSKNILMN